MKRCPTCLRTYGDETLTFCLADGSLLSAPYDTQAEVRRSDSTPTEVMPRHPSYDSAPPTLLSPQIIPATIPAQSLTGQSRGATVERNAYFTAQESFETEEGGYLIEREARIKVPALYIMMRMLVAIIGSLMAYALLSALLHYKLPNDIYWALRILQRIAVGILLIAGQVAVLRKYLKPMWPWVLLTLVAIFITTFIDYFLIGFVGDIIIDSNNEFLKTIVWAIIIQINSSVSWPFVAAAQFLFLLRRVRRAWLWVASAIIAELLFYFANRIITSLDFPQGSIYGFILVGLSAGFIIGTTQTLTLLLFRKKKVHAHADSD